MRHPEEQTHRALRETIRVFLSRALEDIVPGTEAILGAIDGPLFYVDWVGASEIGPEILPLVERRLLELCKQAQPLQHHEILAANAAELFLHHKAPFKAQRALDLSGDLLSLARTEGQYFFGEGPFCGEPIKHPFLKLLEVVPSRCSLGPEELPAVRIWGAAFAAKPDLKAFVKAWPGGASRQHLRRGVELGVFKEDSLLGTGYCEWLPRGEVLASLLEQSWWEEHDSSNYYPVRASSLISEELVKRPDWVVDAPSGDGMTLLSNHSLVHARCFASEERVEADLPFRCASLGEVWRSPEPLPGMRGLFRETSDQATIFCTRKDLHAELISSLQLLQKTINILGFDARLYHSPDESLEKALGELGIESQVCEDLDGLRGPGIVCYYRDSLQRPWRGPYIEVDRELSRSFSLRYKRQDGTMQVPVSISRGLFGSLERLVALILEQGDAPWPLYLAPEQVRVVWTGKECSTYASTVVGQLRAGGLRASGVFSSQPLKSQLSGAWEKWVPYVVSIGTRELEQNQITVCSHGKDAERGVLLEEFVERLRAEASGECE